MTLLQKLATGTLMTTTMMQMTMTYGMMMMVMMMMMMMMMPVALLLVMKRPAGIIQLLSVIELTTTGTTRPVMAGLFVLRTTGLPMMPDVLLILPEAVLRPLLTSLVHRMPIISVMEVVWTPPDPEATAAAVVLEVRLIAAAAVEMGDTVDRLRRFRVVAVKVDEVLTAFPAVFRVELVVVMATVVAMGTVTS